MEGREKTMFQIGQVCQRLGLNPQTVYFYERIGLIPSPQRTEAGYRLFSPQDVERLGFIVRAKSFGLTLDEIKEILALKDGRSLTCQAMYERLQQKVQDIEGKILSLQRLREELLPLVDRCRANIDPVNQTKECIVLEQPEENSSV